MNAPQRHLGPAELTRLLQTEFPQSFAAEGAIVTIGDRNAEGLEETAGLMLAPVFP